MIIKIRRQWNDWRIGSVDFEKIENLHWDYLSGGVQAPSPQPFIHGYVLCDQVEGDIAHSCTHGDAPHRIKICVVKKDQDTKAWQELLSVVGPKPS